MTSHDIPCTSRAAASSERTAVVVVASTRAASGEYEDRTGGVLVDFLRRLGFATEAPVVVADAAMRETIAGLLHDGHRAPDVILTTGGTGITDDDVSVEAVAPHLTKELPGISHAFWTRGLQSTPTAILSRCVAGIAGSTFVMTLPGSTGAVKDGMAVLEPVLHHIVDLVGRQSTRGGSPHHQ